MFAVEFMICVVLCGDAMQVAIRVRQPAISQKYSLFKRADIVRKANYKRIW